MNSNTLQGDSNVNKATKNDFKYDTSSSLIDYNDYKGFQYRSEKWEGYGDSYVDTFNEAGALFRIVHDKNSRDKESLMTAEEEKLTDGKWIKTITFENLNHTGRFSRFMDANNDGYNDLTRELRFTYEVYFFNPTIKNFIDTSTAELNDDAFLLDTIKHIYCDIQTFKGMRGQINSALFTYKNYNRIDLFNLEFYNDIDADTITKLILQKCIDGSTDSLKQIQEFKLKKPITWWKENKKYIDGVSYFYDYRRFWRNNYKKLLNCK